MRAPPILFLAARLAAACLATACLAAACAAPSPRAQAIAGLQGDRARGSALFATQCGACHKAEGFSKVLGWYPRQAFLSTVVTGVPHSRMRSFAALSDQNIADIYAYLRAPAP